MSSIRHNVLVLSDRLTAHTGLSHWSVSMRVAKKGNLFDRLRSGADLRGGTYDDVVARFSEIWPDDLAWPSDIPRPGATATGKGAPARSAS